MTVRKVLAGAAWFGIGAVYAAAFVFAMLMLSAQPALSQGTSLGWGQRPVPVQGGTFPQGQLKVGIVGGVDEDSSAVPFQFDASGNVLVSDATPATENYLHLPSVISSVMVNLRDGIVTDGTFCNRDSTTAIDCRGFNRAALLLFPSATAPGDAGAGSADSLMGGLFALQVRAHPSTSSDSLNTYRIPTSLFKKPVGANTMSTVNDTIGSIADLAHFSANADSVHKRAFTDEQLVVVGNIAGPNRGMVIWSDRVGGNGSAVLPFMSWRLRYIRSYRNVGGAITVNEGLFALPMRVRCDLVLWRE